MARPVRGPSLGDMPTIVIAGGGIAGLEALIALHGHLGSTAQIELLEANTELLERQRAVSEPFGGGPVRRFDLVRIAADHGAHLRPDRLASVDPAARRVRTVRGDKLDYDALLVAVGARPDMAIPGALTFSGPRDVAAFSALLDDLDTGRVQRVAFAVPASVTWALPLYELALMTGQHVRSRGLEGVGLVLVTPEHGPLEAFGPRIASHTSGACWPNAALRSILTRCRSGPGRAG
jgi:sulfide:quinone oxidoreductase